MDFFDLTLLRKRRTTATPEAMGDSCKQLQAPNGLFRPGLDSPGKTHGADSLVPAWPKTMPGVPRHFALRASTLYYFAGDWPWQNPSLLDQFMGYPRQIHKACPAMVQTIPSADHPKCTVCHAPGAPAQLLLHNCFGSCHRRTYSCPHRPLLAVWT